MCPSEADLIALISEQTLIDAAALVREGTLETLGVDSIGAVSMVFALEDKFGVRLEDREIDRDMTLGMLLDLIVSKLPTDPETDA